jgi:hypothetical protein
MEPKRTSPWTRELQGRGLGRLPGGAKTPRVCIFARDTLKTVVDGKDEVPKSDR